MFYNFDFWNCEITFFVVLELRDGLFYNVIRKDLIGFQILRL